MKPVRTELLKIDLLTPGYEHRGGVRECQWCHGKMTKDNKNELIRRSTHEQHAVSVGMMCDECYNYLIMGPEIDFIGNSIYVKYVHEHIHNYDNRHVPSYDPKKSLRELKES